jgi:hypothetical protein
MPQSEDATSTTMTLVGTVSGLLVNSTNVILLSLTFAAALKALPSIYAGRSDSDKRFHLSMVEDWILFIGAFLGYLFTAGTGDQKFALIGLAIASVGKSLPSLLDRAPQKGDSRFKHVSVEDLMMFGITVLSVALWFVTGRPEYGTYGLVFAFIAKGLGGFEP